MTNPHNPNKLPICSHCNRRVALNHNGYCTNSGCGKRLDEPVTFPKKKPVQLHLKF